MNAGDVKVRLIADLKNFSGKLDKAGSQVKRFATTSMSSLGKAAGVFKGFGSTVGRGLASAGSAITSFAGSTMKNMAKRVIRYAKLAGVAIAGIGIYAVKLASTLEQTQSRFKIVFGDMAAGAETWNNAFSDALRQNRSDIQEYLTTFHKMLTAMDFAPDVAFKLSTSLVQVAADLSAFDDVSMTDAFEKITSALVGMSRPLQTLGYNLKDTQVKEEALRLGLVKTSGEITEQQKAVSTLSLMIKVMSKANKNALITMDEAQVSFGAVWAQIRSTLENIGTGMLPMVTKMAITIRDWLFTHQTMFAKWGESLAAALKMAGDVFLQVVGIFRDTPSEGFDVLLESMIAVIKAAGKIAVEMAVRIGKGIWQSVKASVFGEKMDADIEERAQELYRSWGWGRETKMPGMPKGRGLISLHGPTQQIGGTVQEDPEILEKARAQARTEIEATGVRSTSDKVWDGFGDKFKAVLADLKTDVKETNIELSAGIDAAAVEYHKAIAAIEKKYAELPETAEDANAEIMLSTEQLAQQIQDIVKGMKASDAAAAGEQAAKAASSVRDYVDQLWAEVEVLGMLANGQTEKAARQKLVNGFTQKGIELTEYQIKTIQRLTDAEESAKAAQSVREYTQELQQEIQVLALVAQGQASAAAQQQIINDFKRRGIELTETQIGAITRLADAQKSAEAAQTVREYVEQLQQEVQVLALVAQGQTEEAARQQIANDFKQQGIELTDTQIEAIKRLQDAQAELENSLANQQDGGTKWQRMWKGAAAGIDGAMESAFVSITKNAKNATDAIQNMLDAIQESISRNVFEQYLMPAINQGIGSVLGVPSFGSDVVKSPGVQEAPLTSQPATSNGAWKSKGGIIKGFAEGGLVYAQRGVFTPKGTDTVPAMLTPGEGVLDKDTTSRLRRILEVPEPSSASEPSPVASRPINISVNAIDAAGTYQFLQKNKRAIASMVGDTGRSNHPVTRGNR